MAQVFNPQWNAEMAVDDPLMRYMEAENFQAWHTGGGCMAWSRWEDDDRYVLITDDDGTALGKWSNRSKPVWRVGRYNGDFWTCCKELLTLAQALRTADLIPLPVAELPDLCDRDGKPVE
jgi:hypothetical protein